ncbi:PD-(D/E)XK nuclease family protein [Atopobium fossor]|uniref:PD-(D/E)XK nuclease family protein n=1 Tax=Atopobium fossor TaxID=39487 RepID=UPI00041B63A5|nr:PD-(D/E)XK nuclease family protein [Atopobium fossor]
MSITYISVETSKLLSQPVLERLHASVARCGRAVLLVPNYEKALEVQRALAQHEGLALGVTVSTPSSWVEEQWRLYGTGKRIIDSVSRMILARITLDSYARQHKESSLHTGEGTLRVLAQVAQDGIFAVPSKDGQLIVEQLPVCVEDALESGYSAGELDMLRCLALYKQLMDEHNFIELCEVMTRLGQLLPAHTAMPSVVFASFLHFSAAQEKLAEGLSSLYEVSVVRCVKQLGTEPLRSDIPTELLHAAGPLARWELIASQVAGLVSGGAHDIVVCSNNIRDAWNQLMPKLTQQGILVCSSVPAPLFSTVAGVGFLNFVSCVAHLIELEETWPKPIQGPWGEERVLGSMDWWAPAPIIDFLLSDIAGTDIAQVWQLDRRWRGNRILTPTKVLADLSKTSYTSKRVGQAVRDIQRGKIGAAADKIRLALEEQNKKTPSEHIQNQAFIMASIAAIARQIGALYPRGAQSLGIYLQKVVALLKVLMERGSIVTSSMACVQQDTKQDANKLGKNEPAIPCVHILSSREVALLEPRSVDALIYTGMTTAEMRIVVDDGALMQLEDKLQVYRPTRDITSIRGQFLRALEAPRSYLMLERSLTDDDAKPTFPAVMLSEFMQSYGCDSDRPSKENVVPFVIHSAGEDDVTKNMSAAGMSDTFNQICNPLPAGKVSDELAPLVIAGRKGALPGEELVLSASQIESYLECPYKWFSLRRLGLSGIDAGFSNLEKGSFAHRVLEVTHRALLREAAGVEPFGALLEDAFVNPRERIEGSRITKQTLSRAQELLTSEFDAHYVHQLQRAEKFHDQALVPHVASQKEELAYFKEDLLDSLAFQEGKLLGFEPRYFELRFGGKSGIPVTYASVSFIGSIDRIDVDEQGHALIIDYKYRGNIFNEYKLFNKDDEFNPSVLPRHVQSLIYAQVIRKYLAEQNLTSVGAVYLGIKRPYDLSGAMPASMVERVWGQQRNDRLHSVCAGQTIEDFYTYLDTCEELITHQVERLKAGYIEANPIDEHACKYCPVTNCEKRRN